MTDTAELFSQFTCVTEDMHGIAVEGQKADLPDEASKALAAHLTTGLQQAGSILEAIERNTDGKP
uniref:hypothetical protein n=1 Tax=uncultured Erythrobacter sp. TaxID=263913 RepID=UPI002609B6F8|nr:hypothetical protein [uncultured Erythrobacter sp.]